MNIEHLAPECQAITAGLFDLADELAGKLKVFLVACVGRLAAPVGFLTASFYRPATHLEALASAREYYILAGAYRSDLIYLLFAK
ncbi:MAG: hypothetical protein AAGF11_51980 [Myxococcota bacterium]